MTALTSHAQTRSQQRAIPPFIAMLLCDYGACMRYNGADVFYIDKAARRRLKTVLGGRVIALIERWFNAYAVVADDGRLVTVSHRRQRFKRS